MSKLCLGTFLTVLKKCKISTCTQKQLVDFIFSMLDADFDGSDDSMISNLVGGQKNPSKYIIERAATYKKTDYPLLINGFEEKVLINIDPNKREILREALIDITENDSSIDDKSIVIITKNVSKEKIRSTKHSDGELLSGLFLYVLITTNNKGMNPEVKKLNDSYFKKISKRFNTSKKKIKPSSTKNIKSTIDEEIYQKVQEFCIKHENELHLLPLCQIAWSINPMHNYVRSMYTDYCLCSQVVKDQILEHNEQLKLDFSDKKWIYRCIETYDKRIQESGLCSQSFLYDGAKYLHRAFSYHAMLHVDFDPHVFEDIRASEKEKFRKNSNLTDLIYDYLEIRKRNPKIQIESPIDTLWEYCRNYHEEEVTYWVCQIIISSCWQIEESGKWSDETDIRNISIGDGIMLINTQEDMYLFALLELYKYYYNRQA